MASSNIPFLANPQPILHKHNTHSQLLSNIQTSHLPGRLPWSPSFSLAIFPSSIVLVSHQLLLGGIQDLHTLIQQIRSITPSNVRRVTHSFDIDLPHSPLVRVTDPALYQHQSRP